VIVVDTSALMAIVMGEPDGRRCLELLATADDIAISAGTLAETLVVSDRRGATERVETLLYGLGLEVVPVTATVAFDVADAYARWGKASIPPASTSATASRTRWPSSVPAPSSSSATT
jgi:ribonuclease VapC